MLGALAVALIALATLHPGDARGDVLRALVVVGAGGLLAAHGVVVLRRGQPSQVLLDRIPLIAAGIVLGMGVFQLMPLPASWIEVLAPETARVHAFDAGPEGAGWRPLSMEPTATGRAVLLGAAYLALFAVGKAVGHQRSLLPRVAAALGILGAVVALSALVHVIDEQVTAGNRPTEPFVNPNHLAAFLTLCLGPALALAVAPSHGNQRPTPDRLQRRALQRGVAIVGLVGVITGLFLSLSRGGLIAAAACVVLTVLLAGLLAPVDPALRRKRRIGLGLGVAALVFGVGVSNVAVVDRFEDPSGELSVGGRVQIWRVTLGVIGGRPLAGSGLATYDDASFAALPADHPLTVRPESAHNDYLELVSDVGLPVALVGLLGVILICLQTAHRLQRLGGRERALVAGVLAGAVGALLHATVEFALQIPGPALLFAFALGVCWGATRRVTQGATTRTPGWGALVGAGLLVSLGAWTWAQASREAKGAAAYERMRAAELQTARQDRATDAVPALRAAQTWHANAASASELAHVACVQRVADYPLAVESARRAVARAPGRASAQVLLAYLLLDRGWRPEREEGLDAAAIGALEREGWRRLDLAVRLGQTQGQVLLQAGRLELDAFIATGFAPHRERAEELLTQAARRDGRYLSVAEGIVRSRGAALGADGTRLLQALAEGAR